MSQPHLMPITDITDGPAGRINQLTRCMPYVHATVNAALSIASCHCCVAQTPAHAYAHALFTGDTSGDSPLGLIGIQEGGLEKVHKVPYAVTTQGGSATHPKWYLFVVCEKHLQ